MLILPISEDLHELLQNCCLAAVATLCKVRGIVVVTVYLPLVLVVTILSTKDSRAHGAGEMFNVVFSLNSCDIRSAERPSTRVAQQVESPKIIGLTQRVLANAVLVIHRKEFRSDDF